MGVGKRGGGVDRYLMQMNTQRGGAFTISFLFYSHRPSCTGMRGPPTHSIATAPAKATMSAKVI